MHTRSQQAYFWVKQSEFVLVLVTAQGDKRQCWLCSTGEMSFWTPGCCTALEELGQAASLHAGHINTCIDENTVNMTHQRFHNTGANSSSSAADHPILREWPYQVNRGTAV